MQVDELLKPFPIEEFHPVPRGPMGPGAHQMIGPEAKNLGFNKTLILPTDFTAQCGFDVLAHASEPYVSPPIAINTSQPAAT